MGLTEQNGMEIRKGFLRRRKNLGKLGYIAATAWYTHLSLMLYDLSMLETNGIEDLSCRSLFALMEISDGSKRLVTLMFENRVRSGWEIVDTHACFFHLLDGTCDCQSSKKCLFKQFTRL